MRNTLKTEETDQHGAKTTTLIVKKEKQTLLILKTKSKARQKCTAKSKAKINTKTKPIRTKIDDFCFMLNFSIHFI